MVPGRWAAAGSAMGLASWDPKLAKVSRRGWLGGRPQPSSLFPGLAPHCSGGLGLERCGGKCPQAT